MDLINYVTEQFVHSKKNIIFVEGIDASGKTCFALNLKNHLNNSGIKSKILSVDDFLTDETKRIIKGKSSWQSYLNDWFDLASVENLISAFIENGKLNQEYLAFDTKTKKRDKKKRINIEKPAVLIVEGVFLSKKEFSGFPAFRIFLEVSFEESLKRQLKREPKIRKISEKEAQNRWVNWHLPAQKEYFSIFKPKENSDVVINNSDYKNPVIEKS